MIVDIGLSMSSFMEKNTATGNKKEVRVINRGLSFSEITISSLVKLNMLPYSTTIWFHVGNMSFPSEYFCHPNFLEVTMTLRTYTFDTN